MQHKSTPPSYEPISLDTLPSCIRDCRTVWATHHGDAADADRCTASVWTIDDYLPQGLADEYLKLAVGDSLPLVTDPKVYVFGKECVSHRRVGFFSAATHGYAFAGITMPSTGEVPDPISLLMHKVNTDLNTGFNGTLVNHYRDGKDYIGAHSDAEAMLDRGVVAAISVGSERTFRLRDIRTGKLVVDIQTKHGQLLVMDGMAQRVWKHEVPPRLRITEPRVSYTMRMHREGH